MQCLVSHIERNKSRELQLKLMTNLKINFSNIITEIDYLDPLYKILRNRKIEGYCV
jgi:hypothetical protein